MGKVFSLETMRLKRQLKELKEELSNRIKYCEKNGYIWLDHYTIKDLHQKITELNQQLEEDTNEKSS